MLSFSGVPKDQITIKDINVAEDDSEPVTIRTILCGDSSKPALVYCHGYGGSGTLFYKFIKGLISKFYLILIDQPGQGSSNRP